MTEKHLELDTPENTELSLLDLWKMFRRRIMFFCLVVVICGVASVIYALILPRIYKAVIKIKIPNELFLVGSSAASALTGGVGASGIETEKEMIVSKSNIEAVIRRLNLLEILIPVEKRKPLDTESKIMQNSIESLKKAITVQSIKGTPIFEISVEFIDAELSASIANEIVKVYAEKVITLRKSEAQQRIDYIQEQLPLSKQKLDQSTVEIKGFKETHQVFTLSEEANNLLDIVGSYEKQLNSIEIEQQKTKQALALIKEKLSATDGKEISSELIRINPIVNQLRSSLVSYNIELAVIEKAYSSSDFRVIQKKREILETEKELSKQINDIISGQSKTANPIYSGLVSELVAYEINYQLNSALTEAINKSRDEYVVKMMQLPTLEVQLTELIREQRLNEEIFLTLSKSLAESQLSESSNINRILIIDEAKIPLIASKPQRKLIVAIGGVLGIFLGILFVFVLEFLEKRVVDVEEIGKITHETIPLLGVIPDLKNNDKNKASLPKEKLITQAAQIISADLEDIYKNNKPVIWLMASPENNTGTSTLAYPIASTLSQGKSKVLLVDGNFYSPSLTKTLNNRKQTKGFAQMVSEKGRMEEYISPITPRFDFLSAVDSTATDSFTLYRGSEVEEWITRVKQTYDFILIDMPAVIENPETLMFLKKADGILLIISMMTSKKIATIETIQKINANNKPLIGIIANRVPIRSIPYLEKYQEPQKKGFALAYTAKGEKKPPA